MKTIDIAINDYIETHKRDATELNPLFADLVLSQIVRDSAPDGVSSFWYKWIVAASFLCVVSLGIAVGNSIEIDYSELLVNDSNLEQFHLYIDTNTQND